MRALKVALVVATVGGAALVAGAGAASAMPIGGLVAASSELAGATCRTCVGAVGIDASGARALTFILRSSTAILPSTTYGLTIGRSGRWVGLWVGGYKSTFCMAGNANLRALGHDATELREWGITTVIISGTTTENCCHATARDAMFNNYKVVFLSDATGSFDYPDVGYGAMSAEEVHKATLCILAFSTAHVMTVDELKTLIERGTTAVRAKRKKAA